jgi:hypothetical protein
MNSRGLGNSFLQGWLYSLQEKKRQQEMADRERRETARDNRQFTQGIIGKQIGSAIDTQAEIGKETRLNQYRNDADKKKREEEMAQAYQESEMYKDIARTYGVTDDEMPQDGFVNLDMFKAMVTPKIEAKKRTETLADKKTDYEYDKSLAIIRNAPEPPKIITDEENLAARQLIKTIKPEFQFENRKYSMDEAKQYNQNWRDANNGVKPTVQKKTVPLSAEGQRIMKKAKDLYAKTRKNPAEWNAALQEGGILYSILDSAPLSTDEFNTLDYEIRMLDDSSISKPIKDKSFDASNIIGQESPAYTKGKMIGYYK